MLNPDMVYRLALANDIEGIKNLAAWAIGEDEAKKLGGSTMVKRQRAALKYLRNSARNNIAKNSGCAWEEEGLQCFSNGYTFFALSKPITGLPAATDNEHLHAKDCFPAGHSLDDYKEVPYFMEKLTKLATQTRCYNALEKQKPADERRPYCCHIGGAAFNADYALEAVAILGGKEINFSQIPNAPLSAAIMESENGKVLFLPVREWY